MQTRGVLNTAQRTVVSMATASRTYRLSTSLVLLMIISALTPMLASHVGVETTAGNDASPETLKRADRPMDTGARANCPAVQNDGGSAGDAGNTTATAKAQGSDPTQVGLNGCIDTNDLEDWYGLQLSANKDLVVQLRDFGDGTNIDFDIYLSDSTGGNPATGAGYVAGAATYAASERFEFTTNSSTAGTYYIQVVQYNGDGTYKLDFWTNNSVPKPDLSVNSISGPVNATAGDVVDVTYTVENFGPGDTNSTNPYDVVFILSTDDTYSWGDVIVESQIAGPYLTAGSSSVETSQVTIPSDIESDDYHWIVWADGWGNVSEATETNNNNASTAVTTISGMPCPNIDDASTGADVGGVEAEAYDLGAGFTGVITGCVAAGDKADMYMLSMGRGQNITAVLTADNWEADLDLRIWNSTSGSTATTAVDNSAGFDSNESVSTAGSDADGAADTYYINVSHFSGLANYTLEIWTNGTIFIPPYDCGVSSDWGQTGYDAGSDRNTAYDVGDNPDSLGRGCLDPADTTDAYRFSLSGMKGTTIQLESDNATSMHIELYSSENGIDEFISEQSTINGVAHVDTSSIAFEDLDGNFFVIIHANETDDDWDTGWYNLSFTPTEAPLPDLTADIWTCPATTERTGDSANFGVEISSVGGPMDSTPFAWEMTLVHENGTVVMSLLQGSYSDALDGNDGMIIQDGEQVLLDTSMITSGNYTCVLTVDGGDVIEESNESNNVVVSLPFEIINEEELYADDIDRDGVPNDQDGCPNTPGDSTMDRLGCQDADEDGYSNGGDVFIYEPTQWNDTDGDGFGDNNGPGDYNGDACPNEPGVMAGTNGTGCPLWISDQDNDGVADSNDVCPGTPAGASVDALGCSDSDGDGVDDSLDTCPATPTGTSVDVTGCPVDGTDGPGDGTGDADDTDNAQAGDTESASEESDTMLYIMVAAGVVLLLVIVLGLTVVLRGRSAGGDPTEQVWATAISPEQQAYEQQLVGMGYTAEQARAYASQYFQN